MRTSALTSVVPLLLPLLLAWTAHAAAGSSSTTATDTVFYDVTVSVGDTKIHNGGSLFAPSTSATLPAILPTVVPTGAGGSGTGGTTAPPQPTVNAGNLVDGPWRAALGAVIGGVIALV